MIVKELYCRSIENRGAEGDLSCRDPTQDVSEKKNLKTWPTNHLCDIILAQNVAVFCPYLKKNTKCTI